MTEPTAKERQTAFEILRRHPPCIQDGVPLEDLIEDIAQAIHDAAMPGEQ